MISFCVYSLIWVVCVYKRSLTFIFNSNFCSDAFHKATAVLDDLHRNKCYLCVLLNVCRIAQASFPVTKEENSLTNERDVVDSLIKCERNCSEITVNGAGELGKVNIETGRFAHRTINVLN